MFVAMPEGTVIGQLFSALSTASSPSDAADKVADLLQQNGFGGITADEFFSILGTSALPLPMLPPMPWSCSRLHPLSPVHWNSSRTDPL